MTTAKVDNDSVGQQRHAILGGGLRRGWIRAGGERWRRHGVAMMAAAADHGGGGRRRRRTTMTATADDAAADDEGGGRRRHARSGGGLRGGRRRTGGKQQRQDKRLISPPGRERKKIKKSSLCQKPFFSDTVCSVGFFAPAKLANVSFLLYQSYLCCRRANKTTQKKIENTEDTVRLKLEWFYRGRVRHAPAL
jgi:hypothetical protein